MREPGLPKILRRGETSERAVPSDRRAVPAVALASVQGIDASGRIVIRLDGEGESERAALCATAEQLAPGDLVTVAFVDAERSRPLVTGKLQPPRFADGPGAQVVPEELTLEAGRQLTLRCGKSSLILTRAGKVLVRGAYLSSHSSGVHRIQGASVQIN